MILTNENYFSREASEEYMSVSQFKAFENCQAAALAEIRGEYEREKTTALLVGSYVDAYFEGTMTRFVESHPELFKRDGTLKAEYIQADSIIKRIECDKYLLSMMTGQKEVIMTGAISGVPVKIKIDILHPDKIVDRKIVKDFQPIYHPEKGRLPWFEYWGYDLQGAVYQEIVRQNTGEVLPFHLGAATKEKVTDIDAIQISQTTLDHCLDHVQRNIEMYDAIKKGVIEPERCEMCEYCKNTKVLSESRSSDDFYFL